MTTTPYGFRVVGHRAARRVVIDHAAAFAGYAACDPQAELDREAFLSAFTFPFAFRRHFEAQRSEKGYSGACGADWIWWDIDKPGDLGAALSDARRLCGVILDRYTQLDEEDLLVFLSGSKGVHVGLTAFWHPEPSQHFNAWAKAFALDLAQAARVVVDESIYSKVRLFRAPNSRHPKTGLYKRRITLEELTYLMPEAIIGRATTPEPFDIPTPAASSPTAAADWQKAKQFVRRRAERIAERAGSIESPKLNALTMAFIQDGAYFGDRHRLLFSAAANLGEFHCPPDLALALLTPTALNIGLSPSDAKRQIECGLAHAQRQAETEGGAA